MLPHSYVKAFSDIFDWVVFGKCCLTVIGTSLVISFQGATWHPIWIFATFWISPALWQFFAICAKFAIVAKFCYFRQNRHPPRGHFCDPIWIASPLEKFCHFRHSARGPVVFAICSKFAIFAKLAIFAQIAIIAEIATLQGATFGMQFESPLHAFLEISATSRPKII